MDEKIGAWAFIIGVIIAVVAGLAVGAMGAGQEQWVGYVPLVLVVLGFIVGLLNVGDKEVKAFLTAAIALMVTGLAGTHLLTINKVIPQLGTILQGMVTYLLVFVAPAALIVALLEFYKLGSTPKGTMAKK